MVYEKYIKKGGRVFGPYLYETKRINGKVVNIYLGPKNNAINNVSNEGREIKTHDRKIFFINIFIVVFIAIFLGIFFGITFNFLGEDFDLSESLFGDFGVFLAPTIGEGVVTQKTAVNATIVERPVIGRPVKWKKEVRLGEGENVISIPKEAEDIVVKKIKDSESVKKEIIKKEDEAEKKIIGEIMNETTAEQINETIIPIINDSEIIVNNESISNETMISNDSINENKTIVNESVNETVSELNQTNEVEILTSPEIIESEIIEKSDSKEVIINDKPGEYEVEYYTDAPVAFEEEIDKYKKRIIVSGPELGYENILTFTEIPEILEIGKEGSIRVYWVEEGTYEAFYAFDKNNNGFIDYVEWNTPHLSGQTFEISITILNVQSYPTVGGNWTVAFTTTGNADLKIRATNGTIWTDFSDEGYDLRFLELKCGENIIPSEFVKESENCGTDTCYVIARNYSCDATGFETSKVLTPGKHTLKFEFGNETAYAFNLACGNIATCGALDVTNCVYTLTQDVSSTDTCFTVTANNVTLDCKGYLVTYSTSGTLLSYGVNIIGANSTTVKNCKIVEGSSTGINNLAIYLMESNDTIVSNNTISTYGSNAEGIRLTSGSKSMIINNNITTSGSDGSGISLSLGSNSSIITNNTINTKGSNAFGIYLVSSSSNNNITNNTINTYGGSAYGIILSSSSNSNILIRNTISTNRSNAFGIYTESSKLGILSDNVITTSGVSGHGIYFSSSSGGFNITNNTITTSNTDALGIYFITSSVNNTINLNNINTSGNNGFGIFIRSDSDSNTLTNNIVTTNGSGGHGIYLTNILPSSSSSITNNTITINGGSAYGIYFDQVHNSNIVSNNITTWGTSGYGLFFNIFSNNNTLKDMKIRTNYSTSDAINIFNGNHNFTLQDSFVNASVPGSYDIFSDTTSSGTVNFTNVTFNDKKNFFSTSSARLNVHWYVDAFANYTNSSNATNSNIKAFNVSGALAFSQLTGNDGRIPRQVVLSYTQNATNFGEQNNYTFNATNPLGGADLSQSWNMSTNRFLVFTFGETVDVNPPQINFTNPTPPNNTITTNTSIEINVSIIEENLRDVKFNWNGTSYIMYNDSLILMMNMDNRSALGECYDNQTEILTDEGWKYFDDLTGEERVMTLNASSGKAEWEKPKEYQEFEHDGEMYKIVMEDWSEMLVSEKHKVYVKKGNRLYNYLDISSDSSLSIPSNSFVENTLTLVCVLNASSSDQIGHLCESAKAKYGSSFVSSSCGDILLASDKNFSYSNLSNVSISPFNADNANVNSDSDTFENFIIFSLLDCISSKTKSGEINLQPLFFNSSTICLLTESRLKMENNTLASTTIVFGSNSIVQSPCLFATLFFNSSDNSSACSSLNLDFDMISSNIANLTLLTNCVTTLSKADSNLLFNSVGMSNLITNSVIREDIINKYINVSDSELMPIKEAYSLIKDGRELYFLDSEGNEVKVRDIVKEPYRGKIYDVDVENDIVLVMRNGSRAIWSGNSDNKTVDLSKYGNNGTCSGTSCPRWVPKFINEDPTSAMLSHFGLSAFIPISIVDDNTASNGWHTDSSSAGAWLKIDLGSGNEKDYVKSRIYASTAGDGLDGIYDVQYSDDDFVSDVRTAITGFNPNLFGWNEITWNNVGTHRYWRFLLKNTPGTGSWLNELEMYKEGGRYGGAFKFDGINDFIALGNNPVLDQNFTQLSLAFWMYANSITKPDAGLVGKGTEIYGTTYHTDGQVWFYINNGGNHLFTPVSSGAWHYITGTFNGTYMSLYVDGELKAAKVSSSPSTEIGSQFGLGSTANFFNGSIDEVRFWNRSLSAEEVREQYYANLQKFNKTQWYLEVKQQDLVNGNYTYFACAKDASLENCTETRDLSVSGDFDAPLINFTNPTPPNGSTQNYNSVFVNVSTSDANEHSAFINFNKSLIGYWAMDWYNSTGIYDNSSYNNFGDFKGGLSTSNIINAKRGKGLVFDGIDNYVNITTSIGNSMFNLGNNNFSIEVWVKFNSLVGDQPMLAKTDYVGPDDSQRHERGWYLLRQGGGLFYFCWADSDFTGNQCSTGGSLIQSTTLPSANTWYHVAVTRSGRVGRLYINGIEERSVSSIDNILTENVSLVFGDRGDGVFNLNGTLDEIRIWNRTLSPEEVNASFNAGAYRLFRNFTNLADGNYEFKAFAIDAAGNYNQTETRTLTVLADTTAPQINFTNPTPPNGTNILSSFTTINVSVVELNLKDIIFNWNKTNYTIYNDSLVLMMNFDNRSTLGENDTFVRDLSKYGNDGNVFGAIWNSSGRYGGAFEFVSTPLFDYIDLGTPPSLNTNIDNITISAWVKVVANLGNRNTNYDIFSNELFQNYGYLFRVEDNILPATPGIIRFITNNIGSDTGVAAPALTYPNDQGWHHVVVVKDGGNGFIYLDGVQVGFNPGVLSPANSPISSEISGSGQPMNGSIDEVRIWKKSLSADEVREQYYSNLQKFNKTQWYLEVKQQNLVNGNYTYFACAKDASLENCTETRDLSVSGDFDAPLINFTNPTPANNTITTNRTIEINVSIIEENLRDVKFNWNGTSYTMYNDSLILMMNFDNRSALGENDTFVSDLSKYGNDGNVFGAIWNSSGRYGGAFEFDGRDDYINISDADSLDIVGSITVSAWVKANSLGSGTNENRIVVKGPGFHEESLYTLEIDDGTGTFLLDKDIAPLGPCITPSQRCVRSTTLIQLGVWYHLAGTYNGSTIIFYTNGQQEAANYIGSSVGIPDNYPLVIGANLNTTNPQDEFYGSIDEVRIWNRSLSADEIREQYYSNLQKFNQSQWYLEVNQQNLSFGRYTYQAFAEDTSGNGNSTEERTLIVNISLKILDISNLGFQNIQPGKAKYIDFSVIVQKGEGALGNLNAKFSRGGITRENSSCARLNDVGPSIANYSCSVDIWYFDSSGEWNVSAGLLDDGGAQSNYSETFVLMSEAFVSHQGVLSFGNLFPGDTNRIRDLLLNNSGNDAFSEIKVIGRNLLQQPSGASIIPSINFSISDISASSCAGINLDHGLERTIAGLTLAVGNNSINTKDSGSGQEELFICLRQVPVGLPSGEYRAGEANTWEITTLPPHTFS